MAADARILEHRAAAAAPSRLASDLRVVRVVLTRELIRFFNDRMRMVTALVQPVLYIFVLGSGLSSLVSPGGSGSVSFKTLMFPGVMALSVMFTAMFSAASIVWDREFGFLREMLVAPVSRGAIVLGKCLGGATVATLQGATLILLAGATGVPYDPLLILELIALLLLLALAMTSFGVLIAARMRSIQSFMGVTQMLLMPMFFLSGALYPLGSLPSWLTVLTRLNPMTYAVDPLRQAVFAHVERGPLAARFSVGVTWFGWNVPPVLEAGVVAAIALVMLAGARAQFRNAE